MRVLLLGADGFIGRHIAFHLRDKGFDVVAVARAPARLAAMGFATLRVDLTDPATHTPAYWTPHLPPGSHLVNAAGLLTGRESDFRAVHELAPQAALAALPLGGVAVLISAVGIQADTPFAHWRRQTEAVFADHTILRPGLVLADTSYGGSSLLRALAALPFVLPVVGSGTQKFNPVHAADLAAVVERCLARPTGPALYDVGGPEVVTQLELIQTCRSWLGLSAAPVLHVPIALARGLGRLGDVLRLGPISATAVAQLQAGVLAKAGPLPLPVRGMRAFIAVRPAGTQDLWQARLYLLKPLIRLVLAVMWLASAGLGMFLPAAAVLPALPESLAMVLARAGGVVDLALGLALLRNWRPGGIAIAQLAAVTGYTAGLTMFAPALWLDPFGGMLKNLPVLALILIHLALTEER